MEAVVEEPMMEIPLEPLDQEVVVEDKDGQGSQEQLDRAMQEGLDPIQEVEVGVEQEVLAQAPIPRLVALDR